MCPRHLADQYHTDDANVLAGHSILNRIELVGEADGLAFWNVTNKIPSRDSNGAVIGTAGMTWRLTASGSAVLPGGAFGSLLDYFRDHYRESITNDQLALLSGMSVRVFERKFQAAFQVYHKSSSAGFVCSWPRAPSYLPGNALSTWP